MPGKEAYQERLQAQYDEWQAKIELLKARANLAKADAKIDYQREIERLEEMQADAEAKLEEVRNASDDAWDDLQEGFESSWREIAGAMTSALGHFDSFGTP